MIHSPAAVRLNSGVRRLIEAPGRSNAPFRRMEKWHSKRVRVCHKKKLLYYLHSWLVRCWPRLLSFREIQPPSESSTRDAHIGNRHANCRAHLDTLSMEVFLLNVPTKKSVRFRETIGIMARRLTIRSSRVRFAASAPAAMIQPSPWPLRCPA